ncbi:MAG TPA: ABC transporter permease, partial [Candidatus Coprenecus stercoravium]|nr:ABC transporter permease [Candidatus Coprenecus stercoravium]
IGGVLGLVLSWLLLEVFSRQLSMLVPTGGWMPGSAGYGTPGAGYFDFRDFYNIYLGTALLLVIVVLNVLSALLPARRVIRHPITESLNYKK